MKYTKHYYIKGQRICSKLGGGFLNATVNPEGYKLTELEGGYGSIASDLYGMVLRQAECAEQSSEHYNIATNRLDGILNMISEDQTESNLYFYHSDHLGSSSFISDASGSAIQHLQYLPFGETFVDQRTGSYDSRYKFSAKEKDDETGYSYFGARYYDSGFSIWLSVDPMSDKYSHLSPYNYCGNNPIMMVDPNGMEFDDPQDLERAKQSQNYARTRISELTAIIKGYESRNDLSDAEKQKLEDSKAQVEYLNTHIQNIDDMIKTKDYKYKYKLDDGIGDLDTYVENGIIIMTYIDGRADKQAHEETHGHQFITGELKIKDGKSDMTFYDLSDEANAYQIEYSFRNEEGQAYFRKTLGVNSVIGVSDITPENLAKSKVIQTHYHWLVKQFNKSQKRK